MSRLHDKPETHEPFNVKKYNPLSEVSLVHSCNRMVAVTLQGNLLKKLSYNFPLANICYNKTNEKNEKIWVCDLLSKYYRTCLLYDADKTMYSAIYMENAKVEERRGRVIIYHDGIGLYLSDVISTPLATNPNAFLPSFDESISLKDYLFKHIEQNLPLSCWLTPGQVQYNWDILSCVNPGTTVDFTPSLRKARIDSAKLKGNDEKYESHLGIVILPGKMVINKHLVDCPKELKIGGTYLCTCTSVAVAPYQVFPYLLSYKPIELDSDAIQTLVTDDGYVLVKTVVGRCYVPVKKVKKQTMMKPHHEPREKPNYATCYYFPKQHIVLSNKFIWTAKAFQVICGFRLYWHREKDMGSRFSTVQGSVPRVLFELHVLAFFDDTGVWRMPEVIPEMNGYMEALKKMGIPLKPGTAEVITPLKIPASGYPFQLSGLDTSLAKVLEEDPSREYEFGSGPETYTNQSHYQHRPEIEKKTYNYKPYVKPDIPNENIHEGDEDENEDTY